MPGLRGLPIGQYPQIHGDARAQWKISTYETEMPFRITDLADFDMISFRLLDYVFLEEVW
jgi:hypothetical protein